VYYFQEDRVMRSIVCVLVVAFLAVAANADVVITEVMPGSVHTSTAANGDWFELTNMGSAAVNVAGWSWVDNDSVHARLVFPSLVIQPAQSIICLDEKLSNVSGFKTIWGLDASDVVMDNETLAGFWGLGKNGDGVFIYDASNSLVDSFAWTTSTNGFSMDVYGGGVNSVAGVNGAYASSDVTPDVASPFVVVPEPTSLMLLSLGLVSLRSSRKK
jgi:hypothetical protein